MESVELGLNCAHCNSCLGHLPESLATILAICARSLLSSSCRAVVRFSAVTPGFLSPSILLPSRRKLGTDEFLWSTRRGVGRHSCFRGRLSLLKTEEWVISNLYYNKPHRDESSFWSMLHATWCLSFHLPTPRKVPWCYSILHQQFITGTAQSNSNKSIFVKFIMFSFHLYYSCKNQHTAESTPLWHSINKNRTL